MALPISWMATRKTKETTMPHHVITVRKKDPYVKEKEDKKNGAQSSQKENLILGRLMVSFVKSVKWRRQTLLGLR